MIGIILKDFKNDSSARKALLVLLPVLCIIKFICILEYIGSVLLKICKRLTDWCDL